MAAALLRVQPLELVPNRWKTTERRRPPRWRAPVTVPRGTSSPRILDDVHFPAALAKAAFRDSGTHPTI